jgi:hypothetical protein
VNRLSVDDLFQRYLDAGFLYRDKLQRLEPFRDEIMDNWRRAAASPDNLLRVVTYDGNRQRSWASLATWRHTETAWCVQHLVSRGDPLASRAVMMAEFEATLEDSCHLSNQSWFRPDNRLPQRVFGSIIARLGSDLARSNLLSVFEVPRRAAAPSPRVSVQELALENQHQLAALATEARGVVYAAGEGFGAPDFGLSALDAAYRKVGLFRYRRAWLAYAGPTPIAALVAHRGPLGLNYSFIENRADLLVSSHCAPGALLEASAALVSAAAPHYGDFRPGYLPLFVDERSAPILSSTGLRPIRSYCQTLWLRAGYAEYRAHLEATFAKVVARSERQKRLRESLVKTQPVEIP